MSRALTPEGVVFREAMFCLPENVYKLIVLLLFRKETFLDELFSDLDCVGRCTFAEVVGHAPEVEAGLD